MSNETKEVPEDVYAVLRKKITKYRCLSYQEYSKKEHSAKFITLENEILEIFRQEISIADSIEKISNLLSTLAPPHNTFIAIWDGKIFNDKPERREAINKMISLIGTFHEAKFAYFIYCLITSHYSFGSLEIKKDKERIKLAILAKKLFHIEFPHYAKITENLPFKKTCQWDENQKRETMLLIAFGKAKTNEELLDKLDAISGITDYQQKVNNNIGICREQPWNL